MKSLKLLSVCLFAICSLHFTTKSISECTIYPAYSAFKNVLSNPSLWCYGKPMEAYSTHYCNISSCRKRYITQDFCYRGEFTTTFYYAEKNCRYSDTNYHSNLGVSITEPCGCGADGINIDAEY